jgi:hypothetical protein
MKEKFKCFNTEFEVEFIIQEREDHLAVIVQPFYIVVYGQTEEYTIERARKAVRLLIKHYELRCDEDSFIRNYNEIVERRK